ncbi:MAG: hypothetical protein ABFD96_19310 [Armatimonadia bacterium]
MTFNLNLNTDNAAFEDNEGAETARILRALADRLENSAFDDYNGMWLLRDSNGNAVGSAWLSAR